MYSTNLKFLERLKILIFRPVLMSDIFILHELALVIADNQNRSVTSHVGIRLSRFCLSADVNFNLHERSEYYLILYLETLTFLSFKINKLR